MKTGVYSILLKLVCLKIFLQQLPHRLKSLVLWQVKLIKKITSRHEFILNENSLLSEFATLTKWKKMCPGNPNIYQVYSWISLPSFSRNVPTLENVLHRTLFHQYKSIKPKGVFSVWVFSHNSKPLLYDNLACFQTFTEIAYIAWVLNYISH